MKKGNKKKADKDEASTSQKKAQSAVNGAPALPTDARVARQMRVLEVVGAGGKSRSDEGTYSPRTESYIKQLTGVLDFFAYSRQDIANLVRRCHYDEQQIQIAVENIIEDKANHEQDSWGTVKTKKQQKAAAQSSAKKEERSKRKSNSNANALQDDLKGMSLEEELQPEQFATEPAERESRPKTATEREAARLRKKLREIERIEERLARGEKVDPLQLPKLDKKHEVQLELIEADRRVQQEEDQRLEEQRQEEQRQRLEEQTLAMELAAQQEAARKELERREEAIRMEQAPLTPAPQHYVSTPGHTAPHQREQETPLPQQAPLTPAPQHHVSTPGYTAPQQREQETPVPQQAKGMELLSMLQTAQPGSEHGYQQSKQMADKLSGGRGHVLVGGGGKGAAPRASGNGYPHAAFRDPPRSKPERSYQDWYHQGQPQQRAGGFHQEQPEHVSHQRDHKQKEPTPSRWAEEKSASDENSGNVEDFATFYSTALDVSKIPLDQQREAERIAKEIEGTTRRVPDDYQRGGDDQSRPRKGGGAKGCGKAKWDGGGRGNRHRQGHEPAPRWS